LAQDPQTAVEFWILTQATQEGSVWPRSVPRGPACITSVCLILAKIAEG